ncbi:MAG: glycosyltransferase, partial [Thermoplasmata archaeon]|nr:glycosyltransferase [Thermoplasmata archaeon]
MGRNSRRCISFLGRKNAHLTGLFINNCIDKRILRIVGRSRENDAENSGVSASSRSEWVRLAIFLTLAYNRPVVRVAIVTRTIAPIDRGGIQNHVRYIGEDVSALGVDITLYLHRADYPKDLPFRIVQVRTVSLPRLTAGLYVSLALSAGKALKGTDYDVYHGHSMYGWGIAL